jgi:cytochrome c biogenesis protein CcmG, thiol:disulfide interchange protein DsbE
VSARRSAVGFWSLVAACLVVIVLGVVFSNRFGTDPDLTASPLIGKPMADFTTPYLEFDGSMSSSELGGSIAVINFWASWCLGCRTEHPALVQAAEQYADFDVKFVGVLNQDAASNGLDFLGELGRGSPYTYVVDVGSRLGLEFGVLGLPETFLVDRDGVIVGKISGPIADPRILENAIDDLILGRDIGTIKAGDVENR